MKYLIVGSGLFGVVLAHEAAKRENKVSKHFYIKKQPSNTLLLHAFS